MLCSVCISMRYKNQPYRSDHLFPQLVVNDNYIIFDHNLHFKTYLLSMSH